MPHPFTQTYVKMVSAAAEVQEVRLATKLFPTGDYALFESPFIPAGAISQIDERSADIPQDNALAWLPNLGQLMELIGGYQASLGAMRNALLGEKSGRYLAAFQSWEECVLAVLMWSRFQKVWQGQAWIPEDPSHP